MAFYVKPEVYYLAHIIEIGSYNTIKIIFGDLYMDGWVKDHKRGDILEVNVSDIRWDGSACDFNKKTKIRYGYEPKELRNPNWKKNLLDFIKDMPQVTTLNLSNSALTDITALSNSSIENLTLDNYTCQTDEFSHM